MIGYDRPIDDIHNNLITCNPICVYGMLRKIRILFAGVIGAMITFYFLDMAGLTAGWPNWARLQFVPALLSGSFVVLIALLLVTVLFGRIYCSVICPLGIFQDVAAWVAKKMSRKKHYSYSPEKRGLRYGVLGVVIVSFFIGVTVLLSLTDPYSAYGRMVVNVLRPLYLFANNLLAWGFNSFGNYTFYHMDIYVLSVSSFVVGVITFVLITFLAWRYGRTWCNTACPVGTLLGFLARYSVWRVQIDAQKCVKCGLCERKCKAGCIDSKSKKVDHSRCVDCYNCLSVCHYHALKYSPVWRKPGYIPEEKVDISKRQFLSAWLALSLAVPGKVFAQGEAKVKNNKSWQKKHPLSPPGSQSAGHLLNRCTACHLCVAKCPSHVLKPAFMEYGLAGMLQPKMDFEHGFCNFDCTVCADVCPNGALLPLTKEEKHRLQLFVRENCIVHTDGTSCGACSEHCPTQAVSMVPYKNGLTIPSVNPDICVGCGGCEYVCPVRPFRAIYIEGNPVHKQAKAFAEAEKKEVILDDFGF